MMPNTVLPPAGCGSDKGTNSRRLTTQSQRSRNWSKITPIHHTQRRHTTGWGIATIGFNIMAKQCHTIKRSSAAIPTTQSLIKHSCVSAERTKRKATPHWRVSPTKHSPSEAKIPKLSPKQRNEPHAFAVEQTEEEAPIDPAPETVLPESPKVAQPSPPKPPPEVTKPPPPEPPKAPQPVANVPSAKKVDTKPHKPPAEEKRVPPPKATKPAPEPPKTPQPVPDPSLAQQLGLSVKTIVIDPGHGGKDPGAVSQTRQEKQIVLSLSKTLRDILVKKGYNVRLTRETDVFIPLRKRTQFARNQKADLFISIHTNASISNQAAGIETYYLALASDESARITAMRENAGAEYNMKELDALVGRILKESKSTESRRLAEVIQAQLASGKQVKNRGVKHAPFVVLIGTKVPAVLVEVGFISNPTEGKKLTTKAYQRQLATAIAKGIEQYIKNIPSPAANQS